MKIQKTLILEKGEKKKKMFGIRRSKLNSKVLKFVKDNLQYKKNIVHMLSWVSGELPRGKSPREQPPL